jgi:RNA ligase (TIGR02306 family)
MLVPKYKAGDVAIYVPPDVLIPEDVAMHWGVTQYLGRNGRVKSARLRGQMSHGFLADLEPVCGEGFAAGSVAPRNPGLTWALPIVGDDVAWYYGITKWEPPIAQGGVAVLGDYPGFHRYTSIENFENHPDWLIQGEEVVITEKIHGSNSRVARIVNQDGDTLFMAGTHRTRVRPGEGGIYETPLQMECVQNLLRGAQGNAVILFGELYGWVQSLRYGHDKGKVSFAAFDISVDGQYLNADDFDGITSAFSVPKVPLIHRGPFDAEDLRKLSGGSTRLNGDHIKEGVVVKPVHERYDRGERVILKRVSDEYRLKSERISDSH